MTHRQVPPAHGDAASQASASIPAEPLLQFFAEHGRDLPWRDPDAGPWAVLVSEVMSQQTPVARVVPVYLEWLRRWPTPAALAGAATGDVVRAWGRLGYPRRALRLHAAAVAIVNRFGGHVPPAIEDLLSLPGVGEYTARAVAAFAFGQRHPVVDTNVRRVISRAVRGVDEHGPATARDRADLEALLPPDPASAAAMSAALMELGALLCVASTPRCDDCPLVESCAWRKAGYPQGPPRRAAQAWHGTDRQMRGAILAVLRDSPCPVDEKLLVGAIGPLAKGRQDQVIRCVASLVADGLAARTGDGALSLPA